jgi:hypothetical protein
MHLPTTTSPQKRHVKTPSFAKTPCKNALPPRYKKIAARQKPNRPFFNPPPIRGRTALHRRVKNLFPHHLIFDLFQGGLRQSNRQNILDPRSIMKPNALDLVRG